MFSNWARNDLGDYRAHYPNNSDDVTKSDNVRFYRNEIPLRPENKTIEEIHEKWYGDWDWLEYCHSYIQWLFPIQESGLNWQAQVLQKHEIETMKNDPQVLRRILTSFELMLDFFGFEIVIVEAAPNKKTATTSSSSPTAKTQEVIISRKKAFTKSEEAGMAGGVPIKSSSEMEKSNTEEAEQNNQDDDDDDYTTFFAALDSRSKVVIRRITNEERGFAKQFHNLNVSSHNYLRITRMLKFLGEMGLEHLKLAWLAAFEHEIFNDTQIYNCADSYERYWIGTIYDDDVREAVEKRAQVGTAKARALKEQAWAERYGSAYKSTTVTVSSSSAAAATTETTNPKTQSTEDETSGIRVITDFGGNNNNDDYESNADGTSAAVNNNNYNLLNGGGGRTQVVNDYVFVMNSSDMESATASDMSGARAASNVSNTNNENKNDE